MSIIPIGESGSDQINLLAAGPNPSPLQHGSASPPSPPAVASASFAHASGSESTTAIAEGSSNVSKQVEGFGTDAQWNASHVQKDDTHPGYERTDQEGTACSQSDPVGSIQINVGPELISSQVDRAGAGQVTYQSNCIQAAGRKSYPVNGNHLLNFYYDPISRSQARTSRPPPPRRQRKIKPYNKDLFLQANFKFVVLDTGSYDVEAMDPDKMLQWEDVICVKYSTPMEVQCPICLDSPLCPQITSCGHIYCFPCILRYLLMGKEDHKGDVFKKCPLCFMMISHKELSTIFIHNVKQFHVGDVATFSLLGRSKSSLMPSLKNQLIDCSTHSDGDEPCDLFSKFTLTSDIESSVREAKGELNNWLEMANSGPVDDLEKLPYVCAALEQLEERLKNWMEYKMYGCSPPMKSSPSPPSSLNSRNFVKGFSKEFGSQCNGDSTDRITSQLEKARLFRESSTDIMQISSSPESVKSLDKRTLSEVNETANERDSYTFYQAADGQLIILHPLNMRCLLNHFGNNDMLPPRISGKILELENVTQSEATRKRYRFISHFSLTTTFQFCEIDLSDMLPASSLSPFMDEIKKREKHRARVARKEEKDRARSEVAEVAALASLPYAIPIEPSYANHKDVIFTMDDFEALGSNSVIPSSSPPVRDRKLRFSDVARLGFAAAHDSPPLRADPVEPSGNADNRNEQGPSATTLSFSDILSSARATASPAAPRPNGIAKRGKKPARVLLSTSSGHRY